MRSRRNRIPYATAAGALATAASIVLARLVVAAPLPKPPATLLASITPSGDWGNDDSLHEAISLSCRKVVFESSATNFTANDQNDRYDVFVRDVVRGTTSALSLNREGTGTGNGDSTRPSINDFGRYVVFNSEADDLVDNDGNGHKDVFLHDLLRHTTRLVSETCDGKAGGNAASEALPAVNGANRLISSSGRFVVFDSEATDLVDLPDANGGSDVFVRDTVKGTTTLVSVNRLGTAAGAGHSQYGFLSANGRYVVFNSDADDLVEGDANGRSDVFVRDLWTGTTKLVSVRHNGRGSASGSSQGARISYSGRYVLFESDAQDIVALDRTSNGAIDVFVRDMAKDETRLVSVNMAGDGGGNNNSHAAQISRTGRRIAFVSHATDLVPTVDHNFDQDIFVRDMATRTTMLVSTTSAGTTGNFGSWQPSMSDTGRFVLFASQATDIGDIKSRVTGGSVFLRDIETGSTTLVSVNAAGTASGDDFSDDPQLSLSKPCGAFASVADDLVTFPPQEFAAYNVFVRFFR